MVWRDRPGMIADHQQRWLAPAAAISSSDHKAVVRNDASPPRHHPHGIALPSPSDPLIQARRRCLQVPAARFLSKIPRPASDCPIVSFPQVAAHALRLPKPKPRGIAAHPEWEFRIVVTNLHVRHVATPRGHVATPRGHCTLVFWQRLAALKMF